MARLAVSALADLCTVHLAGEGAIRTVAGAHGDAVAIPAIWDQHDVLLSQCGVEEVARTGRSILRETEIPDGRTAFHLSVPMCARERSLGVLCVTRLGDAGRRFEPADVALCEELGRRAAMAIDNARLYGMAQRAARAREEFLTSAAHELRTPIVPLKLAVQGLLKHDGTAAPERRARLVASVERSTARLASLVEELLDISELAADRIVLSIEPVDLAEVVAAVLDTSRRMLAGAGCEVRTGASGPTSGRWDRSLLAKALGRLLSNAAKYGHGSPVEVAVEGDGEVVRLVVRDHGIGVPPEEQARIFERFERAVSTRHYGGLGFGLWSVRRIAEAHGGSIRVESAPGAGATFTLELPRSGPGDGAGAGGP